MKPVVPGEETRLEGVPISNGIALARVCLFNEARHSNLPIYRVDGKGREGQAARVKRAFELVGDRLDAVRKRVSEQIGEAEAGIFQAQLLILQDPAVREQIDQALNKEGLNAEGAVIKVFDAFEERLRQVDNEEIRERATDLGDLKRRLLDVLANMNPALQCAGETHCQRGHNRIIVAEELTPALTIDLDTNGVLGFVTERGGPGSHAAILARALDIPAVSGLHGIHGMLNCGTELLVNGQSGEIVLWPAEEIKRLHPEALRRGDHHLPAVPPVAELRVMANISQSGETAKAVEMQAEGIGLYRTEFEFLARGKMLDEDEQFAIYSDVLSQMAGKPVTFRLLDVGGDKGADFLNLPHEDNPYLGFRGSRVLMGRPKWLREQARALVRASRIGPVRVLYPMIVDTAAFLQLRQLFDQMTADLEVGDIQHGVMFEVPSACLQARQLLEHAEFGSIGTNDLIQYLYAVDRNNEWVAADYARDHGVLYDLIRDIAAAARAGERSLSVCGELAADPAIAPKLVDLGIRTVSVSTSAIPRVRQVFVKETLEEQLPVGENV